MKVLVRMVLDTNVLVSGLLRCSGPPGRVLELILSGQVIPVLKPQIMEEYSQVLARPRLSISPIRAQQMLRFLAAAGEWINQAMPEPNLLCIVDEGDRPFAEAALASGVQVLITGNKKHFTLLL